MVPHPLTHVKERDDMVVGGRYGWDEWEEEGMDGMVVGRRYGW